MLSTLHTAPDIYLLDCITRDILMRRVFLRLQFRDNKKA